MRFLSIAIRLIAFLIVVLSTQTKSNVRGDLLQERSHSFVKAVCHFLPRLGNVADMFYYLPSWFGLSQLLAFKTNEPWTKRGRWGGERKSQWEISEDSVYQLSIRRPSRDKKRRVTKASKTTMKADWRMVTDIGCGNFFPALCNCYLSCTQTASVALGEWYDTRRSTR